MVLYVFISVIWLWMILVFREPVGDPGRYVLELDFIAGLGLDELLSFDKVPLGFALLNWLTALVSTDSAFFFSMVYVFCVVPLYLSFRERFDKVDAAVLMMLYLLYPFYLSGLGNIFKQGIASGFMLWGLTCLLDQEKPKTVKGIMILFSSVLFHSAFLIPIFSVIAWYVFFRKRHIAWALWLLGGAVTIAMFGLSEAVVTAFIPKDIIEDLGFGVYFDTNYRLNGSFLLLNYVTGFRLDFTLFTIMPLLGVLYVRRKVDLAVSDEMIKVYCLLSTSYFLLCFIPYADRLASISWFIVPYLIYFYLSKSYMKGMRDQLVIITVAFHAVLMLDYNKEYFQWLPF